MTHASKTTTVPARPARITSATNVAHSWNATRTRTARVAIASKVPAMLTPSVGRFQTGLNARRTLNAYPSTVRMASAPSQSGQVLRVTATQTAVACPARTSCVRPVRRGSLVCLTSIAPQGCNASTACARTHHRRNPARPASPVTSAGVIPARTACAESVTGPTVVTTMRTARVECASQPSRPGRGSAVLSPLAAVAVTTASASPHTVVAAYAPTANGQVALASRMTDATVRTVRLRSANHARVTIPAEPVRTAARLGIAAVRGVFRTQCRSR